MCTHYWPVRAASPYRDLAFTDSKTYPKRAKIRGRNELSCTVFNVDLKAKRLFQLPLSVKTWTKRGISTLAYITLTLTHYFNFESPLCMPTRDSMTLHPPRQLRKRESDDALEDGDRKKCCNADSQKPPQSQDNRDVLYPNDANAMEPLLSKCNQDVATGGNPWLPRTCTGQTISFSYLVIYH
ncbi:hypothetical protein B0O99DRAFT_599827 [Bisporella sp. PMI_857]|nr:hypothetical protein B0O99DRAFT_599827 [Bisporella sp. PMI_857]